MINVADPPPWSAEVEVVFITNELGQLDFADRSAAAAVAIETKFQIDLLEILRERGINI